MATESDDQNLEYVRGACEQCGQRAIGTPLQSRAKPKLQLCEDCFIEECNHPGETRLAPQSGTEHCGHCGVRV